MSFSFTHFFFNNKKQNQLLIRDTFSVINGPTKKTPFTARRHLGVSKRRHGNLPPDPPPGIRRFVNSWDWVFSLGDFFDFAKDGFHQVLNGIYIYK